MRKFLAAIAAAAIAIFAPAASAQVAGELYSWEFNIPGFGCTGLDIYVQLATAPYVSAGLLPTAPVYIVGYELSAPTFAYAGDYVMIGNAGANGDAVTFYQYGAGTVRQFFPAGEGFYFDPATGQLHMHYSCQPQEGSTTLRGEIWYVGAPGSPVPPHG